MTDDQTPALPRFSGVEVPEPEFAGDDGGADPELAQVLASYDAGRSSRRDAVAALVGRRLMTPLVAVLEESQEAPSGLRQEKSSHMATVSLVAPDGRRALLAFTSVAAMAAWDPTARGIPAPAARVAAAALEETADAVVVDLAGPVRLAVEGAHLRSLAAGTAPAPPWDDPEVGAAVLEAARLLPGVARVRLAPPEHPAEADSPDLVILVEPSPAADPDDVADRLARLVLADRTVAAACPRGVAVGIG